MAGVRIYREGLAGALGRDREIEVAGTATTCDEALHHVTRLRPDVVVLDVSLPQAVSLVLDVLEASPVSKVIALAVGESAEDVVPLAEAGIAGYVPRDASLKQCVDTVKMASRGELLCTPRIAAALARRLAYLADGGSPQSASPLGRLTSREREIAALLNKNLSNKEIARGLGISTATVKNHVHNILEKVGASRRWQVQSVAIEHQAGI